MGASGNIFIETGNDGAAAAGIQAMGPMLYNGATFDMERNNQSFVALASLTDTANGRTSADFKSYNARGIVLLLDITARNGTGSMSAIALYGKTSGGNYRAYANFQALGFNSVRVANFAIYPGVTQSGAFYAVQGVPIPPVFRIQTVCATDGAGNNLVYTVDCQLLV